MNIGHKIRKVRELKGYDQKYMAHKLGMDQSNYSKLENNGEKITFGQFAKIAESLEVDPLNIISFDEKFVLNIKEQKNCTHSGNYVVNHCSPEIQALYENQIKHYQEEVKFLRSMYEGIKGELSYLRQKLESKE